MKNKNLEFKNIVNKKFFNFSKNENLKKKYFIVLKEIIKKLDYPDNIFFSLSKKFIFNFELKNLTKYKKYKKIVIIGMGGSVLGSEAIYCFFKDKIKKNFSFINNIDNEKLKEFDFNKNSNKTLFIVISKSGNTIETLSNFFSLKILKNKAKNLIFISEKGNNFLNILTKNKGLNFIEHRKYIGGRYSVLSEVGMLPAYLMNLKINKFRKNLLSSFQNKNKIFLKKSSIMMANFLIKKK